MLKLTLGFITLITGRQLYGLFAGGVAFIGAFFLAPIYFNITPDSNLLMTSLGIGVVTGLLATLLGRIMTAIVLFLAGGYLLATIPGILGLATDWVTWPLMVVAGLVVILLALVWFDFSLILLSTLTGASLIVQTIQLNVFNAIVAYFALVIFGIVTQLILMQYWPTSEEK
ncbi:MAG TPA: hypothetical protein VE136_09955 [Anaerolineales bacterium]|nr:hypothetical protein [Anaerolineales bacterium]